MTNLFLEKFLGGTSEYEKKVEINFQKPEKWLKTVVAFSNFHGGKILFGINDFDEIIGIKNYKESLEKIAELIYNKIHPDIKFKTFIEKEENKIILVLEILEGNNPPYFLTTHNNIKKTYKRFWDKTIELNQKEIRHLYIKGSQFFIEDKITNIDLKQSTFNNLRFYYNQNNKFELDLEEMKKLNLVNKDNKLTFLGTLFSQEYYPKFNKIICTKWKGKRIDNNLWVNEDEEKIEGNILFLFNETMNFFKRHNRQWSEIKGSFRKEYKSYSEEAFREVLINALVHRNYEIETSNIQIDIYDDEIKIKSPGNLYGMNKSIQQLQKDNLLIESNRRNPKLCSIFEKLNLMEQRGTGIQKVINFTKNNLNYQESKHPIFYSDENNFIVFLKNMNFKELNENKSNNQELDLEQEKLLRWNKILKIYNKLDLKTISELLGVNEELIKEDIKEMKISNLLKN